jgi:hypothetical protein
MSNKYSDMFIKKEIINKLFFEIGVYLIKNIINLALPIHYYMYSMFIGKLKALLFRWGET